MVFNVDKMKGDSGLGGVAEWGKIMSSEHFQSENKISNIMKPNDANLEYVIIGTISRSTELF